MTLRLRTASQHLARAADPGRRRAAGQDITGTWVWQDGFFCREMAWGSNAIPYDCQLVEVKGSNEIRFTVDRGAGDDATFVIR